MRNILFTLMLISTMTVMGQTKGRFDVYEFNTLKLHVYYTNDALGDASYIVEGKEAIVTLEQPLFKDNVAEFDTYLAKLGKPVEQRVTNYHIGGTGNHDHVMVAGMPKFTEGPVYGGMIRNFQEIFGDSMTDLPTGKVSEVNFNKSYTWAGITFEFRHGATGDFPAASIIIGDKVYYTHWTPAQSHISHLQITSPEAIDAEIAEAEKSLESGCELFIGGHGGATNADAVRFKIRYLKDMKRLLAENKTEETFIEAMKKAYPDLPEADGLTELAKALYK